MTLQSPEAEAQRGLLDTSVFIGRESGRPIGTLPSMAAISVITLAELQLGVLMATDPETRTVRRRTLTEVELLFEPLPIDASVARAFADLVAEARHQGRRPKIMDAWIAATAMAHELAVFTQDADFSTIPFIHVVLI